MFCQLHKVHVADGRGHREKRLRSWLVDKSLTYQPINFSTLQPSHAQCFCICWNGKLCKGWQVPTIRGGGIFLFRSQGITGLRGSSIFYIVSSCIFITACTSFEKDPSSWILLYKETCNGPKRVLSSDPFLMFLIFSIWLNLPWVRGPSIPLLLWIDCKHPVGLPPITIFMHKVFMPLHIIGYKFFDINGITYHQHPPATTFLAHQFPRTSSSYLRFSGCNFNLCLWSWFYFLP